MPTFGNEVKLGNIQENWLFILNNDNSGAVYIAFKDEVYNSNFYHGVILNKPSIRESINLSNSTAKSGNISISIPDFDYQGSPISEELFGGSDNYINQIVSVHSMVNGQTPVQIGSFRLTDISSDGNKLDLSMSSHRPWDFIDIPQDKSNTGIYEQIVYGDYTKNPHDTTSSFLTSKSLFPLPNLAKGKNNKVYFIYPQSYGSNAEPHYYDKNLDLFIPFDDTDTATTNYQGSDTIGVPIDMERGSFLIRPLDATNWTNPDNAIDTSTTSKATETVIQSGIGTNTSEITLGMPSVDGELTEFKIYVKASINVNVEGGTGTGKMYIRAYSADTQILVSTAGTQSTAGYTINGVSGYSMNSFMVAYGNQNVVPETLTVKLYSESDDIGVVTTSDAELFDIVVHMKVKNDTLNETTASHEKAVGLEYAYAGVDGLTESWSGGSNAITEIHEAHRDMLIRYAGLSTSDPEGWTNLNADKDWGIRWWALEPEELKKTLEKLQYEGGFIFRYKGDGSAQYIHIRDSLTTNETLNKYDVKDFSINHTPFSDLLTKMDISYEKHPAENRYITTQTSTNSTARTDWNIQTKENISQVNLDAYVSPTIPSTPSANTNDDFYTYYDSIFGTIKTIVSGTIINTKYYGLDVGDILEFENMYPEKIFGESWSGKQYMITSLHRSPGTLKFEAREL